MKKYLISLAAMLGAAAFARMAVAAVTVPKPNNITIGTSPVQATTDITLFLCGLLNWIFWGLIVLAIIMVLVGGYYYVTSAGEADKVSKANKTLLYAAIAVVVALVAQGVPLVVGSFLGNSSTTSLNVCNTTSGQ
jgi:hypothetical protein